MVAERLDAMDEIGQFSFYLANENETFDSILRPDKLAEKGTGLTKIDFEKDGYTARFYCFQTRNDKSDPPWLKFINTNLPDGAQVTHPKSMSINTSGVLLLKCEDSVLASAFGVSGASLLNDEKFKYDFGIRTAMNMCGSDELRQAKSRVHSKTTTHIDRQVSQPSELNELGILETEMLQYISANLKNNPLVSIQGKNNITIKISAKKKLDWKLLTDYAEQFIKSYSKEDFKDTFPDYLNFQHVPPSIQDKLNELLIADIHRGSFDKFHLSIPEFISDDEYGFCYSEKGDVYSYLSHEDVPAFETAKLNDVTIDSLRNRRVYGYSYADSKVHKFKSWSLYSCIVYETPYQKGHYVLSAGSWQKVDDDFYKSIQTYLSKIKDISVEKKYHDINIYCPTKGNNRESVFNEKYCDKNDNAIKFDQSYLAMEGTSKNKEFCDILEYIADKQPLNIVHVKQYCGKSGINYLFSQARFYGEAFATDQIFLSAIKEHINKSTKTVKTSMLPYIADEVKDLDAKRFNVCLWLLYDKNITTKPTMQDLPFMAQYDLKMTHKRLIDQLPKFCDLNISFIPVERPHTQKVQPKAKKKSS